MSLGDFALETTIHTKFTTRNFSTGAPATLSGTPVVDIYEDNSVTQITAAETLTVDFDSVTGLNHLAIAATAANGFEAGKFYQAVITTGTVGGVSVVGEVVAEFSIEATAALRPTTAGRTLDVTAAGEAGIDLDNTSGTLAAAQIATGAITAAKFAAGAIDAAAISADAGNEIADALLNRDMSAVSDTTARSPLNALRFLRNKWSISGTTLTVTKEDDSTSAWTSTLTEDATANPVTGSDPA